MYNGHCYIVIKNEVGYLGDNILIALCIQFLCCWLVDENADIVVSL